MSTQEFEYPTTLKTVVDNLTYKENWEFELEDIDRGQGSKGLTLSIYITTPNSHRQTKDSHRKTIRVVHYMPIPPAAYDFRSWTRWVFDQIVLVERHESCEFFEVNGIKSYAPSHGPGNDPYLIREIGTKLDVRTSFRGEVNE